MCDLLVSLTAFFETFAGVGALAGTLSFASDGASSTFRRPKRRSSAWSSLAILDPTREGQEVLDLAPQLQPATQLLLAHEMRQAAILLRQVPRDQEETPEQGKFIMEQVFAGLAEDVHVLPSHADEPLGALFLIPDAADPHTGSEGAGKLELVLIDNLQPRSNWSADFLRRDDRRSEVRIQLCDVEERTGRAVKRQNAQLSLCACHFVCRIDLQKVESNKEHGEVADGSTWEIGKDALNRFHSMRQYVLELSEYHLKVSTAAVTIPAGKEQVRKEHEQVRATAEKLPNQAIAQLPSPARSRGIAAI